MTAAQTFPLSATIRFTAGAVAADLTPRQRAWLHALTETADRRDRPRTVIVEPAETDRRAVVVYANWGASRDHEYAVWTVRSTGTAEIW